MTTRIKLESEEYSVSRRRISLFAVIPKKDKTRIDRTALEKDAYQVFESVHFGLTADIVLERFVRRFDVKSLALYH